MDDIIEQYAYLSEDYSAQEAVGLLQAQVLCELKESIDDLRRELIRHEYLTVQDAP